MAIGTYLTMITLNINELNASIRRQRGWMDLKKQNKTRTTYMLPSGDSLQIYRHTGTESERLEKGISCKWKWKESWSSNTYIRQNRH